MIVVFDIQDTSVCALAKSRRTMKRVMYLPERNERSLYVLQGN